MFNTYITCLTGQLWRYFGQFNQAKLKPENFYAFIYKAHLDSKNQPSIKSAFFHSNKTASSCSSDVQKIKNRSKCDLPSTSQISNSENNTRGIFKTNTADLDIEDSMSCFMSLMENGAGNDSDDVIEATPPTPRYKKPIVNRNPDQQKPIQNDVVDLIDMIDGVSKKKDVTGKNVSLLSAIDELSKQARAESKEKGIRETNRCLEEMDVDDVINTNVDVTAIDLSSANQDNMSSSGGSTLKRKITDYFVKTEKG